MKIEKDKSNTFWKSEWTVLVKVKGRVNDDAKISCLGKYK